MVDYKESDKSRDKLDVKREIIDNGFSWKHWVLEINLVRNNLTQKYNYKTTEIST